MALTRRLSVKWARPFALALLAATLSGCGGDADESQPTVTEQPAATADDQPCRQVEQPRPRPAGEERPPSEQLDPATTYVATVTTNCGTFEIQLDQQASPKAAASFAALARRGFFDNTIFHRIVPGFVIQGGDPTQSGSGGPGYQTVDTPAAGTTYEEGTVAMAKAGSEAPGTAGSQFFVVTAPDAGLPRDYAVIGHVRSGMDVVQAIGRLGDALEQPTQTVLVESIAIAER
jgi:peptidyl-prolyl cis-trans isomerase B (cyclophilin B)